jgi:hypothetical protein
MTTQKHPEWLTAMRILIEGGGRARPDQFCSVGNAPGYTSGDGV